MTCRDGSEEVHVLASRRRPHGLEPYDSLGGIRDVRVGVGQQTEPALPASRHQRIASAAGDGESGRTGTAEEEAAAGHGAGWHDTMVAAAPAGLDVRRIVGG